MLFDLRGRGRRRTVQILYLCLALLMGVGLVGFGVGGGLGGGGLLTAASKNEGGGGASFSSQISKQKKILKRNPSDAAAWVALANVQLHEAAEEKYVTSTGITSKGKELFSQIANSWNQYLALDPPKPNLALAKEMVRVFGEEGLNQPAAAVQVLQIVVAAEPQSSALFSALAEYAYRAKNTRQGDLASEKAVSLAPKAERKRLKEELEAIKKNPSGSSSASSTTAGASGASSSSGGEAANSTITVGGKSYKVTQKVKEELESTKKK
jgi:hypothetical protein